MTEDEWGEEWSSVLRLASSQPRSGLPSRRRSRLSTISEDGGLENPQYESLEEIHVLVLAHVIRRPIFIVADLVLKVSSLINQYIKNCPTQDEIKTLFLLLKKNVVKSARDLFFAAIFIIF